MTRFFNPVNFITMKTKMEAMASERSKYWQTEATSAITDAYTGSHILLPDGYQINRSNGKTWIGRSTDGQAVLLVERAASAEHVIPTMLSEGELDLLLVSTRLAIDQITPSIIGIEACGELAGREVLVYLSRVAVSDKISYLVLTAGEAGMDAGTLKEDALNVARRFVQ